MPDQLLANYIEDNLDNGVDKETIVSALKTAGWQQAKIDEAFAYCEKRILTPSSDHHIKLLSPFGLLKVTWDLYLRRLTTLIGIYIIAIIPSLLLGFMVIGMRDILEPQFQIQNVGVIMIFLPISLLFVLSALMLLVWSQLAIIHAIHGSIELIGIQHSYKRAWKQIMAFVWLACIVVLLISGGTLLLFIPGILFAVWFSLSLPVLVSEDIHGTMAILKSKAYIQGYTFPVMVRFIVLGLTFVIIYSLVSLLFSFLRFPILFTLVQWALPLIFIPFAMTFVYQLYNNLKVVKGTFYFSPSKAEKRTYFLAGLTGLVGVPVVVIFLIILLYPRPELMKARDSQRLNDLRKIQVPLQTYFTDKKVYPADLNVLVPSYIGTIPKDPKTQQAYEYKVASDLRSYELCAKTESNNQGRICIPTRITLP